VGGVAVVTDEVLESGLSKGKPGTTFIPINGIRKLTLADGTEVHGCRDCLFDGALGEVRRHRNAEHGEAHGGARPRTPSGVVIPPDALERSLGELLELAVFVDDWSDLLANLTRQRDDALEALVEKAKELSAERRAHNALKKKIGKLLGVTDAAS
jgi:hypothetical protein